MPTTSEHDAQEDNLEFISQLEELDTDENTTSPLAAADTTTSGISEAKKSHLRKLAIDSAPLTHTGLSVYG